MSFVYFESGGFLEGTLECAGPALDDGHSLEDKAKNLVMMVRMEKVQEDVTGA